MIARIRSWLARPSGLAKAGPVDPIMAAVSIALLGFGIVMVYSASTVEAAVGFGDPQYYLKRQAAFGVGALVVMVLVSRFDYHRLRPLTYPILGAVTLMLMLSVMGFGHSGGGATRWLRLGPIHIQPSEAAKLGLVLWLAYSLAKKKERVKSFSVGMLPHLIMAGGLILLCLKQPDFGGSVVLLFLTFTLLFVAGARLGYLLGVGILGAIAAGWLVQSQLYRMHRIMAFMDMTRYRHDLAYQPFQSVMSFGSGGWFGLGLGNGLQVLYLPEAHTDFVSAIIGEELGFFGILMLISAYLVIVVQGVRAALRSADDYGAYIAFGISVLFGIQALVNLAVAMSMLPTKGLTLPFISYGGSSLLVNAAAMGVLLNTSRERRRALAFGVDDPKGKSPEASALVLGRSGFGGGHPGAVGEDE
ncbi:MAG: putative lipid II flippase FtsW [Polyangiaceae bacterium]